MIRYAMYGPCGVKRKFEEVEGMAPMGTYIEQRQTILDISMYKLRMMPGRRTEPSLRRSVLIYNTLRVIEHELQAEGVPPNPLTPNLFPVQEEDVSEMPLDSIPGLEAHVPLAAALLSRPDCPPSPLPIQTVVVSSMDTSSDVPPPYCTSPLIPCSTSETSSSPTSPISAAPTSPEDASSSSSSSSSEEDPETEPEPIIHTLQPVTNAHKLASSTTDVLLNNERLASFCTTTTSCTSVPTSSVLFDLDSRTAVGHHPMLTTLSASNRSVTQFTTMATSQRLHHNGQQVDIFGDIDLTLYDFDLLSSFSSNVKMAPLSAEELMHSFPSDTPPTLSSPSPCFRNELLNDDLDHIMQVLVGI